MSARSRPSRESPRRCLSKRVAPPRTLVITFQKSHIRPDEVKKTTCLTSPPSLLPRLHKLSDERPIGLREASALRRFGCSELFADFALRHVLGRGVDQLSLPAGTWWTNSRAMRDRSVHSMNSASLRANEARHCRASLRRLPYQGLCFSSAEDAAEGPSETEPEPEPEPSEVDLATSAVAN